MGLRLSSLTFLGFYVNNLLEDHPGDMSFKQVHASIEAGSVLEDLDALYPGQTDFSLFRGDNDQREYLLDSLKIAASVLEGRERRKTGVEKCGLNLLMAVILQAIQQLDRA